MAASISTQTTKRLISTGQRTFIIASRQLSNYVDRPPAAAQHRGLDEIMAHDAAAERFAPAQHRQPGAFRKSAYADRRVMAPIIAVGAVPPREPVRDQRSVEAAGELLNARE